MHYLFNSNGECVITAQSPIEPIDGYTHVESTEVYNPWEIRLIDGKITKQEPPKEDPIRDEPPVPTVSNEQIMSALSEISETMAQLIGDKNGQFFNGYVCRFMLCKGEM